MSADLVVAVDDGVAVVTLNRPAHLNAYTADMGALLSEAYLECESAEVWFRLHVAPDAGGLTSHRSPADRGFALGQ